MRQLVWSAWAGEASNRIELIDERHFEFTTVGELIQPQHASYWKQLCDHRQLFTADAYAMVKSYLERSSLQGTVLHLLPMKMQMHLHDGAAKGFCRLSSPSCSLEY